MAATKDNITIKKNGISMNLNAGKGRNGRTMFHLKEKILIPKGSSHQEPNINLP